MAFKIPFFPRKPSGPPKRSVGPSTRQGWQTSGPILKREGERSKSATTSISNVGRGSSDRQTESRAASSITRAMSGAGSQHAGAGFSQEEQRQADERRYNYIRSLIKARKAKEKAAEEKAAKK